MKNIIKRVTGPLARRVQPEDELLSINGKPVQDVLDYKFYSYEPRLLLEFRTAAGRIRLVRLRKAEGDDPGLEFETYLMDRPRSCANNCVFCFIDQNSPGMRKSIYIKDDDARLSFLMGCYITLTNL
ncbi:MAG: radical SAM protein, partial [Oscillospiraceae bacterium]|nr:radical SAM protein [Oscillospiraceae bacterium]